MQVNHFFDSIVIVEWLRDHDPKTGTALARELEAHCREARIQSRLITVANAAGFRLELSRLADWAREHGRSPILHLETHADSTGIGTSTTELVRWKELVEPLRALNVTSRMNLLVTMAACHGLNLVSTLVEVERAPVWGLVGPDEQVMPSDVQRGFLAFFRTLLKRHDLNKAIASLRRGDKSNPETWHIEFAETFFARTFADYLRHLTIESLQQQEDRTVARGARDGLVGTPERLESYRRLTSSHRLFFAESKRRSLMLDLFPENADRFPVGFDDILRANGIHEDALPRLDRHRAG